MAFMPEVAIYRAISDITKPPMLFAGFARKLPAIPAITRRTVTAGLVNSKYGDSFIAHRYQFNLIYFTQKVGRAGFEPATPAV